MDQTKTWDLRKTKYEEDSETKICKKGTPTKVVFKIIFKIQKLMERWFHLVINVGHLKRQNKEKIVNV